ncbi:MAG: hypothetical protein E7618_03840 [Ruminococcaceae bacterium]|nr:hypothetical protein [Oscillospiraceae bacterium]
MSIENQGAEVIKYTYIRIYFEVVSIMKKFFLKTILCIALCTIMLLALWACDSSNDDQKYKDLCESLKEDIEILKKEAEVLREEAKAFKVEIEVLKEKTEVLKEEAVILKKAIEALTEVPQIPENSVTNDIVGVWRYYHGREWKESYSLELREDKSLTYTMEYTLSDDLLRKNELNGFWELIGNDRIIVYVYDTRFEGYQIVMEYKFGYIWAPISYFETSGYTEETFVMFQKDS